MHPALRAHSPHFADPVGIIFIDSVCSLLSLLATTTNFVQPTMASVFTAPLGDRGCYIKGLQWAALPIIFQFRHCLTAVASHLIYAVAFVGDRDHYRANTEKKHITAWPGSGREGDGCNTEEQRGEGRVSLGNGRALGGQDPRPSRLSGWSQMMLPLIPLAVPRCPKMPFLYFSLVVAVKAIPLCFQGRDYPLLYRFSLFLSYF